MSANAELDWLLASSTSDARGFYSKLGVEFPRVFGDEAQVRCFANPQAHSHDDRKPSCSVNVLTGLWHCKGCGMSGNAYQAAMALGRPEEQARAMAKAHGVFLEREKPEKVKMPTERQLKKWWLDLQSSEVILARLWELKGWTRQAVQRLGVGWDGERLVFPIREPKITNKSQNMRVVGAVRYLPGGSPKSKAVPGSRRLLFPCPELTSRKRPLFIVEGEPDAVAVWSCGHQAVAIPGTGGWKSEFVLRLAGRKVVMLADCDQVGRELGARVAREVSKARWVDIEPGRSDGYDIGNMIAEAAREGGLRQMHDLLGRLA